MSKCRCGSEHDSMWYYDGHNIELFKGCPKCEEAQFKKWRVDIKTQYQCEETIEPEPDINPRTSNRLNQWEQDNQ